MENFYDPEGIRGVRRIGSPKALFEFYSDKKCLNWFDRTQRTYVQSWRIKEKGMWGKGEESIKLAIEAIDDVLDTIPGYKAARRNADRYQQVIIINKFLTRESNLGGYFRRHGLWGLMNSLRYPDGRHVLRKRSLKSLLEFYDEKKGLRWFDRRQDTYVQAWRIREVDMWQKGEESARLSVEAIEDVLYDIPGYKVAEKSWNRYEQIRLINDLLLRESRLMEFFQNEGLNGLMKSFFDPNGIYGLRRRNSPKVLLEFYSDRKNLNWFDRTQKLYLQGWRIRQHNMWNQGEESAQLAIEAIEDVLYDLPGYKEAEKTGNRDEQLRIIDNLIRKESGLKDYFMRVGLYYGMMMVFWDKTGRHGIKNRGSPKAVLEFYSERKGLNWFDRNQTSYIEPYRNASLRVKFRAAN